MRQHGRHLCVRVCENVLSLSKCEKLTPWRRSCTKKEAVNVLGDDLANGVHGGKTVGWCHQECESKPECGCFKWDPVEEKCHLKKTKTDAKKNPKQCSSEKHEGMFQLVSGTCK